MSQLLSLRPASKQAKGLFSEPIEIQQGLTLGRHPQSGMRFKDMAISFRHGHFEERDGAWYFVDDKSTNGFFIDNNLIGGEKVGGESVLTPGMAFRVAMFDFRVIRRDSDVSETERPTAVMDHSVTQVIDSAQLDTLAEREDSADKSSSDKTTLGE